MLRCAAPQGCVSASQGLHGSAAALGGWRPTALLHTRLAVVGVHGFTAVCTLVPGSVCKEAIDTHYSQADAHHRREHPSHTVLPCLLPAAVIDCRAHEMLQSSQWAGNAELATITVTNAVEA